ncbi:MAG: SRPBCC family protein [Myxococcota bacterium]
MQSELSDPARSVHTSGVYRRVLGLLLPMAAVASAQAEERTVLSRADRVPVSAMNALTQRGDVALIELGEDGRCRQVALFGQVQAPPAEVWDLLMDVEQYPAFIRTMDSVRVVDVDDGLMAYRWTVAIPPLLRLSGTRLQRGYRPHVIEARGHSGALRGTRERFELFSVPGGTLVGMYRALDLETGGLLMRTLMSIDAGMEEGMTLASLLMHLNGVRHQLRPEPDPDPPAPAPRSEPLRFSRLELEKEDTLKALTPLLELGTLAVIESHPGGKLRQVAVLTTVEAPRAHLAGIVGRPGAYPEFMKSLKQMEVERTREDELALDWKISVPMASMSGQSKMVFRPDGSIDAWTVGGDVKNGRWRWEFHELDASRSVPVHYVYSDLRESSFFTRIVLKAEPMLEHGIVGASGTVAVAGMKARAEGAR